MRHVAIVGAGELGGLCAHAIARRQSAGCVRLVDDSGRVAAGMALDIRQASPVEAFATELSGSGDLSTAAGADAIVFADPASGGEWAEDEAIATLERLAGAAPRATIVCAAAGARELVERGVREARLGRRRLIGSAPEALAAALRGLIALEIEASPRDVSLALFGVPPADVVVPWEDASAHGLSLVRVLDEPARRRLAARVPALWPPGPYALASAAALAVDGLAGRSRRALSAFVAPDDALGRQARTAAMPVQLDASGASPIRAVNLNPRDQIALDNATRL